MKTKTGWGLRSCRPPVCSFAGESNRLGRCATTSSFQTEPIYRQALKSWLSRGFGHSRHLHARFQKSWLSPCFGSSPHLHAYMQTDLTAFLLYAIRRPSRDITVEWPSSRRKRKHTQGFGNREPRCQSSGLLGKLKTDSRISERIAFCRVSGWRGLTVKAWFKLLGVVSFRGCTGLKPLAKLDKTVFHSGFTFQKRPHSKARVETRMQLTVDAQKMC